MFIKRGDAKILSVVEEKELTEEEKEKIEKIKSQVKDKVIDKKS